MRDHRTTIGGASLILLLRVGVGVAAPTCPAGATCLDVTGKGNPSATGLFFAACSGRFPDFIVRKDSLPPGYNGPTIKLSQSYPTKVPTAETLPWTAIKFKKDAAEATRYLYAVRDYALDGMVAADFRPEANAVRKWFHVPYMNYDVNAREAVHGLTSERGLQPPEIGLIKNAHNYAIGFYNERGGYTLGKIWKVPQQPNLAAASFGKGTVVFKILFTDASSANFPPGKDITAGAPEWQIAVGGKLVTVRLLQMDVAVRDDRAISKWVYGTFAYDASANGPDAWHKLRAVGAMWGDDPGYSQADRTAGKPLKETFISADCPAYALGHLGYAGRLNGPVDNPVSSCISCHSTAQYPVNNLVALTPFRSCDTEPERQVWFRDLGGKPFGAVDRATCVLGASPPKLRALGTSLQVLVALHQQLDNGARNPCAPATPSVTPARSVAGTVPVATDGEIHDPYPLTREGGNQ
jgi:hypothetical protein